MQGNFQKVCSRVPYAYFLVGIELYALSFQYSLQVFLEELLYVVPRLDFHQ